VALLGAVLVVTAASGQTSSAAVITNKWQGFMTFPVNTCNSEAVFVLDGVAHILQLQQPDGTIVMTTNGHFTEVGSLGNRYQMNWQERFVSSPKQSSYSSRQLIVSNGSAPNHLVTFTFTYPPGDFTAVEDCRGS
jgi:hypothetical protein